MTKDTTSDVKLLYKFSFPTGNIYRMSKRQLFRHMDMYIDLYKNKPEFSGNGAVIRWRAKSSPNIKNIKDMIDYLYRRNLINEVFSYLKVEDVDPGMEEQGIDIFIVRKHVK